MTEIAPALLPAKGEEAKRPAKRARKEVVETQEPTKSKKHAAKAPEGQPAGASVEEVVEEKSEGSGTLVVAKAVRTLLKNHTTPMHCGSDALPALNAKIVELINEAMGRALANGRKTLKNSDF